MSLSWDDLKVLLAVSRAGSLTGAASLLGIDQSTAGRRLSGLEAQLGVILFVRSKTGLLPTEAGEVAIERTHEIERRVLRIAEAASEAGRQVAGPLRLYGNTWMLARLVGRALPALTGRHPGVELRISSGSSPRSLGLGEPSLALWFESPPREPEFAVKLGELAYAVYALRGTDPETAPWAALWDPEQPRHMPTRWLERERRPDEAIRIASTDSSVILSAIRAGTGKGLLPMCLGAEDPTLVRVGDGPPDLIRMVHIHAHPDTIQMPRVQATMAWLRESYAPVFGCP